MTGDELLVFVQVGNRGSQGAVFQHVDLAFTAIRPAFTIVELHQGVEKLFKCAVEFAGQGIQLGLEYRRRFIFQFFQPFHFCFPPAQLGNERFAGHAGFGRDHQGAFGMTFMDAQITHLQGQGGLLLEFMRRHFFP